MYTQYTFAFNFQCIPEIGKWTERIRSSMHLGRAAARSELKLVMVDVRRAFVKPDEAPSTPRCAEASLLRPSHTHHQQPLQ